MQWLVSLVIWSLGQSYRASSWNVCNEHHCATYFSISLLAPCHWERAEEVSQEVGKRQVRPRQALSKILSCSDTEPVANEECSTDIRAHLLQRCATVARDPGVGVCRWLTYGACVGLVADPNGIDDVFPRTVPKQSHDHEDWSEEECGRAQLSRQ